MSAATRAVVEAHIAAFNGKDLPGVVAGFADDAVFVTGEHMVVGHRGLRALFAQAFDGMDARLHLQRAVVEGETAACEMQETIVLEHTTLEVPLAAFFIVRDEVIVRAKVYREGSATLDA